MGWKGELSMNEQADKERMNCASQARSVGDVVSPVARLEAVTRKVWLDDDGKIKVESTCLGCGKTFVLRLGMPLFLTQMTAATCASHAYEFWHAISDKYMRRNCVVCENLTFLPNLCGECRYDKLDDNHINVTHSRRRDWGNREFLLCQGDEIKFETRYAWPECNIGGYNDRERKISLRSEGSVEIAGICRRCNKPFASCVDSHEFVMILANEIGMVDALKLWKRLQSGSIEADFYGLENFRCCCSCLQKRPEWDVFDLCGRMWEALGEMKQSMQCNDDGTCVIRKKCPECQKVFSFRLPVQKIEEWESWLEQYDYDGRYLQHDAGDDDWQYHPYGFWRDMPRVDAQFIAGLCVFSNVCRKCERRKRKELVAMLKNNARKKDNTAEGETK